MSQIFFPVSYLTFTGDFSSEFFLELISKKSERFSKEWLLLSDFFLSRKLGDFLLCEMLCFSFVN
jgi:hypothetical protein